MNKQELIKKIKEAGVNEAYAIDHHEFVAFRIDRYAGYVGHSPYSWKLMRDTAPRYVMPEDNTGRIFFPTREECNRDLIAKLEE